MIQRGARWGEKAFNLPNPASILLAMHANIRMFMVLFLTGVGVLSIIFDNYFSITAKFL